MAGLFLVDARPFVAGVLCGLSLAIKPTGLAGLVVVMTTRRRPPIAFAIAALATVAGLAASAPKYLVAMLGQSQVIPPSAGGNVSVYRALEITITETPIRSEMRVP